MKRLSRWLALVFSGLVLFPSIGSTQAPYYAGKTITVIEGNSAGGTADLRTKSIMQFLQKYIPGNPTIVTQYVPGGGGRQAANQVFRAAADGLTIGATSPGVLSHGSRGVRSCVATTDLFDRLTTVSNHTARIFGATGRISR